MARPLSNQNRWADAPTPPAATYRVRPGMEIIDLKTGARGRMLQVDDKYGIYRSDRGHEVEVDWETDRIAVRLCDADVPRDIAEDAYHCNADPFYLACNELARCAMRIDEQLRPYDVDDVAARDLERALAKAQESLTDLSVAARPLWMWGDLERQRAEHEAAAAADQAPETEGEAEETPAEAPGEEAKHQRERTGANTDPDAFYHAAGDATRYSKKIEILFRSHHFHKDDVNEASAARSKVDRGFEEIEEALVQLSKSLIRSRMMREANAIKPDNLPG